MKISKKFLPGFVGGICLLMNVMLFPAPAFAFVQSAAKQERGAGVVEVEAKYVCMINNQRFQREQIAIQVKDRTYYGCCEMCKAKLQKDPQSRTAVDPVSNRKVDKAKAVIGASEDGRVYYFENAENMKRFNAGS